MRRSKIPACLLLALLACASACHREAPAPASPAAPGATSAVQAVRLVDRHLVRNDLVGFVSDGVPPPLRAQLETAWREGRTRWPLDRLPLARRLPGALGVLAADDAPTHLQAMFDEQFRGAGAELKSAAATLGAFGTRYVRHDGNYPPHQREYYAQAFAALAHWATSAPLADPGRARAAIARLTAAARQCGLHDAAGFARAGMVDSLRRLGPVLGAAKAVLASYGLSLDQAWTGARVDLQQQDGPRAVVRARYVVAGTAVDALFDVEQVDGRWYLSDLLREARAAVAAPPGAALAPPPPGRPPLPGR